MKYCGHVFPEYSKTVWQYNLIDLWDSLQQILSSWNALEKHLNAKCDFNLWTSHSSSPVLQTHSEASLLQAGSDTHCYAPLLLRHYIFSPHLKLLTRCLSGRNRRGPCGQIKSFLVLAGVQWIWRKKSSLDWRLVCHMKDFVRQITCADIRVHQGS